MSFLEYTIYVFFGNTLYTFCRGCGSPENIGISSERGVGEWFGHDRRMLFHVKHAPNWHESCMFERLARVLRILEHGTRNTEHGTRNTEHGTRNTEHIPNDERRSVFHVKHATSGKRRMLFHVKHVFWNTKRLFLKHGMRCKSRMLF